MLYRPWEGGGVLVLGTDNNGMLACKSNIGLGEWGKRGGGGYFQS